jgi:hypothetical protein
VVVLTCLEAVDAARPERIEAVLACLEAVGAEGAAVGWATVPAGPAKSAEMRQE